MPQFFLALGIKNKTLNVAHKTLSCWPSCPQLVPCSPHSPPLAVLAYIWFLKSSMLYFVTRPLDMPILPFGPLITGHSIFQISVYSLLPQWSLSVCLFSEPFSQGQVLLLPILILLCVFFLQIIFPSAYI